ncbi:MAG TPA: cyclic nucleotide-binding domain-containing protein [Vicinamibacteria bacterium]|nr:cyclic nucleotide-binding domain-containing protein [Vicinamibacteria bacterium]
MDTELILSPTDKLLHLGRVAWSRARFPVPLRHLSIAAEYTRQRAFPSGAALAREGEPMASCWLLVQGRVRVLRRGRVLGESGPGSLVGLEALLSQDQLGLGVVAATDVVALELDSDALLELLGDQFPMVHEGIRSASRRLLDLVRRLPGPRDDSARLLLPEPPDRPPNLVEVLLFLRAPGGPFERSSLDALAELASGLKPVSFERGHVFWREGERADRMGFVVAGSVACESSQPSAHAWSVGPGRFLGLLEAVADEPRWYEAVAETEGVALEQDVGGWADAFEDNVGMAVDFLAWLSRTTLALIERELWLSRELFEFFTTLAAPPDPSGVLDDGSADPIGTSSAGISGSSGAA